MFVNPSLGADAFSNWLWLLFVHSPDSLPLSMYHRSNYAPAGKGSHGSACLQSENVVQPSHPVMKATVRDLLLRIRWLSTFFERFRQQRPVAVPLATQWDLHLVLCSAGFPVKPGTQISL